MLGFIEGYGHWGYIWTSLLVTLVLLLADLLPPLLRQRQLRRELCARERRVHANATRTTS